MANKRQYEMANDDFDDVVDKLDELRENAQDLDGENEAALDELYNDRFMRKFTDFDSIEEFFEQSPWTVESEEDIEAIPEDDMDDYVNEYTRFPDSEEMQGKAAEERAADHLGF